MLPPLIRRARGDSKHRSGQRGFTMAFVAITMVAIISMAALSIDIGTLYEAKAEAQRSADAGALAAAQVISLSGITGDPGNSAHSWQPACGGSSSLATLAANNVAQQNLIGGSVPSTVNVYYGTSSGVGTITDCSSLGTTFAVNPVVEVYVQQAKLPTFFAKIFSLIPGGTFSNSGVSATAAAEAFNPSGTGGTAGSMIPVQPRCVKPWIVPNLDPGHSGGTAPFVDPVNGSIQKMGISTTGVIGETFTLVPDCGGSSGFRRTRPCTITESPQADGSPGPNTLDYVPGQVSSSSIAIAANSKINACSEASRNDYTKAVAGCDQTTIYACGVSGAVNTVDLTEDPGPPRNDSANAAECLINADGSGADQGQDVLTPDPLGPPYNYPFQINAGTKSVLVTAGGIPGGSQISSSPSIVSLPIYDNVAKTINSTSTGPVPVTIVGFLQVFINSVTNTNNAGTITVTVMNVAGCGNAASNTALNGTSPVPVRLITLPVATPP
jgi:hypothetical protein